MLLQILEIFKHFPTKLPGTFFVSSNTGVWLLLHKVGHIINIPSLGIRLSYLVTESHTGFIENKLQNFEQATYTTFSNADSSLVNVIPKHHSKTSKMAVTCKS